MRSHFLNLLAPLLLAAAAPAQTPEQLLTHARHSIGSMNGTFEGWMIVGNGQTKVPFLITAKSDGTFTYKFFDPAESLPIRIGTSAGIQPETFSQEIRNTGITREDLSLWQLSWPSSRPAESKMSNGLRFHVVTVSNPSTKGAYGAAEVWIHQKSLALFRIDAFDRSGNLIRKMEVQKIRNFGDQRIAEQMRISAYAGGKKTASTYVQLVNQRN
ncbi:MAG: outer membrane lipoprotein-sorting protein [Verrucomicrobia bacterium]|jgi:hypothetical protein|nr:MAG: outer membrane lipoprotein-sorting protein [Verrucomicrobiota bacterium]